ncbi:MAG: transporter substrate-binding domain-containing protein [Candidatus Omnitrophica bacterium]|nr:transporter substrate-binding domain-containing protein [Candidatus Omnitrophota bacterium]
MKKTTFCILLIVFFTAVFCCRGQADISIKVGIYEDAPLVFVDSKGKPAGICVDILEKIASKEGWRIEYIFGTWPQCLERLKSGEIDLLLDIVYTQERSGLYDFTAEFIISDWGEAYARKESGVQSILDSRGKIVAGVSNDIYYLEFKKLAKAFKLDCAFVEAGDYAGVFKLLEENKVDIGIVSRLYGAKYGNKSGVAQTAIVFAPEDSRIASPKGKNGSFLKALDRNIVELKEDKDSYYYRVLDKWLGDVKTRRFLNFLFWFLISALGLLLIFVLLSLILKIQVGRRTRDLTAAYSKLKETQEQLIQAAKMEVVGGLASGVAHEVKNPLAIIIQGVEYLEKKIPPEDQNILMAFNNVKTAVERADNIVRDLLDFSRVSKLNMEPENINTLCEKALSLLKYQLDKSRIEVVTSLQADIPAIKMDKNKIEQVILNLLMNALQASFEGGRISVKTRFNFIAKEVALKIEDNGSGIPEEALGKIFDPFFTTKRGKGGTGLGLSVVRNIVEMHGGKIEIKNNRSGEGAAAILTFKA